MNARMVHKLTIVGVLAGQVDLEVVIPLKRIGSAVPWVVVPLHERGMLLGVFWVEARI
jgi:hypothetical protein